MIDGVDIVVGFDVINYFGGVTIREGVVQFLTHDYSLVATGNVSYAKMNFYEIDDEDFHAVFDGKNWTVEWFWKNIVICYSTNVTGKKEVEYDGEVNRWI